MEQFPGHAIRKTKANEFALILYLDDYLTEFGNELLDSHSKLKNDLRNTSIQIVNERYNGVKVSEAKIKIDGITVSSIPLETKTEIAAEPAAKTNFMH
ncbi:hypothetical protein [Niallia oryzisoli]|uniref:hypothetical protein n=1 Tax=Niallia oryzisoli TaxID=1737571 RepID=UPI003734DB71